MASIAASTSGQSPDSQRGTHPPGARHIGQRHIPRLAIPRRGERMELACRVESDPRVPVELVGFGQKAALLLPGHADTGGVVARRPLERVEREIPATLLLPTEFASGKRGSRIRVDAREFLRRDPVWRVAGPWRSPARRERCQLRLPDGSACVDPR